MAHRTARAQPLSALTLPFGVLVAAVVAVAWYVTWATQDLAMSLMGTAAMGFAPLEVTAFFALLVVMMVAMMLPSALPMILAYRGLTRLEGGRPVRPADDLGTALFVLPYFAVWGAFAAAALLALMALGMLGPFAGPPLLAPAAVVLAAGLYQFTRPKDVCLSHCESPMDFVMRHWRSGRTGAVRMGTRHAAYCIGCCWLFMLVLFVAGAMSLAWMGVVSVAIFAEKVGSGRVRVSRPIGGILFAFGALLLIRALV